MASSAQKLNLCPHPRSQPENRALVTGNQLETERTRVDFNLPNFDREVLAACIEEANRLIRDDLPVRSYMLPRSEALKIPGLAKMAEVFPPDVPSLRAIEIVGLDRLVFGGPSPVPQDEWNSLQ